MIKYLMLYKEFMKQNLKVMLEYKNDFLIGVFSTFFTQFCGIFFVWILFQNVKQINGWSFYQIVFVYGLLTLAKALDMIFFYNLMGLGWDYIREGKFDVIMIRPVSPLFQIIAGKIQQEGFGYLIIGLLLVSKAIRELHLHVNWALLAFFVLCGGMIFSAINLITSTSAFWTVRSHNIVSSVASLQEFALYPLLIYPKFIGAILTWIIPYAFASFYPATFFLNKEFSHYVFLSPFIAIFLWFIALRVWNFGLSHYSSTGS